MEKPDGMKDIIRNSAIKLFREQGYNSVTLKKICEESGISMTTFYYHYKSKEDLLSGFLGHIPIATMERMQEIILMDTCWQQIWALTEDTIQHYLSLGHELMRPIIEANLNSNYGTFDIMIKDHTVLVLPLLKKAQAKGEVRNMEEAEMILRTGWYVMLGLLLTWCIKEGKVDIKSELLLSLENLYSIREDVRIEIN